MQNTKIRIAGRRLLTNEISCCRNRAVNIDTANEWRTRGASETRDFYSTAAGNPELIMPLFTAAEAIIAS